MLKSGHLHVIVPTHNRVELLERCLRCLVQQDESAFSVTVVDDGSTDGTKELLEQHFPQFDVIRGNGDLWWTGAVDAAVQSLLDAYRDDATRVENDAVVLFNDDVEFDVGFLSQIRSIKESHPKTLIGSVVLDIADRSTIVRGGATMNWWTAKIRQLNHLHKIEQFESDYTVDVYTVSGRGVLIPFRVFCELGSYNVLHYPQHGDVELPVRAARAGYALTCFYTSRIYCHFDLESDINTKTHGITDIKKLLFDKRSYLNLREHFWMAVDMRKNPIQFCTYFVFAFARISKSVLEKLYLHYTRKH